MPPDIVPLTMDVVGNLAGHVAAVIGHLALTVFFYNRLHTLRWHWRSIKRVEKVLLAVALAVGLLLVLDLLTLSEASARIGLSLPLGLYRCAAWLAAALAVPGWLLPKLLHRSPMALVSNDTTVVDMQERLNVRPLESRRARMLACVPGNQLLRLSIHEKTIRVPGLPAGLDGLRIAHLSDLHMTGDLGQPFYDLVVDETNRLTPDLVAITGDILEKEACLPWIAPTLGRLSAAHGKYFVLGNHEQRLPDAAVLRTALQSAGLSDVASTSVCLTVNGHRIGLAGNELPWFGSTTLPAEVGLFRILLAHSPDQLPWAKERAFHLMLAGHTHGGQIRLPWLGALIAPSRFGFRYASGLFCEEPTVMHVSRGLAGIHPIRLNCPPELALLVLRTA